MSIRSSLLFFASVLGLAACVYEGEPPRRLHHHDDAPDPSRSTDLPAPAPVPSSSPGPSSPMLVEVDADQTMSAAGGEGVGVFVEYGKGGHWYVWWTCDTAQSGQSCDFTVSLTALSGSLANVDVSALPGRAATSTATRIDARSTTTSEVHGVRFDTDPGATIELEASAAGVKDGSFLFFVQDGKVKGGFTGVLTNPLDLKGNAP